MPSRVLTILLFGLLGVLPMAGAAERARLDLNGPWEFRTDPKDEGKAQAWATRDVPFPREIDIPGAWQAQGVGEPNGPLRHDYGGVAWYRRTVRVPEAWRGRSVRLRIGGAHRYTTLYVNGEKIGEHGGFSAPFSFDVTDAVRPGADNAFALRVVNPGEVPREGPREQKPVYPTGMLNYLGNWGGIYGNVELQASDPIWIEQVYIRPDVERQTATFVVTVQNRTPRAWNGNVRVSVASGRDGRAGIQVGPNARAEVSIPITIQAARLWSPAHPNLYTARIALADGRRERDRIDERFGMRQLQTRGNVLLLNGAPLYLRGYGDDNIEVLTGFPPSSREVYLERLRQARAFGFNAVRFHSMTPPEAFFDAADEVGLFVMAELPAAYTQYVLPHTDFLRRELEDVLMTYRNRPSLLSVAFGNEFNLSWLETEAERKRFLDTVASLYTFAKSLHPDGLILSNDGYVMKPTDLVSRAGGSLPDVPVVKHEFGNYYCSLPDISLIEKFTGVIDPEWLRVKKQWVQANGLSGSYAQYVRNSQRLQQLGRKYQIEGVRRQPDITGYHYWLIVDFPGGTGEGDSWEEGWFDYFWQPKGVTPRDGQALNSAVIALIDAGVEDRTQSNDTPRTVNVTVSNYGEEDLVEAPLSWKITSGDKTVASGISRISVPTGNVKTVTQATLPAMAGREAHALTLTVDVDGASSNSWSFWSFPRDARIDRSDVPVYSTVKWAGIRRLFPFVQERMPRPGSDGLLITSILDDAAVEYLRSGGRVWLMAERGTTRARSEVAFFPAAGGALGTLVRNHAALEGFPHDGFGDLQFFNLMDNAVPLPLDKWPTGYEPIVGGIRTTAGFLSKSKALSRVGYVFEAKVGDGRLLVSSLRFREHLDEAYPEVIYLFDRLMRYATGASFKPTVEAGDEHLEALRPPS